MNFPRREAVAPARTAEYNISKPGCLNKDFLSTYFAVAYDT